MYKKSLAIALLTASAFISAPLMAQAGGSTPDAKSKRDPNEIVCEKQKIPGSRLATAKVCKTRAEWADLKLQDRMDLERAQTQRSTDR
jgi:hypothetical protein